jgi:hypothetical protein
MGNCRRRQRRIQSVDTLHCGEERNKNRAVVCTPDYLRDPCFAPIRANETNENADLPGCC